MGIWTPVLKAEIDRRNTQGCGVYGRLNLTVNLILANLITLSQQLGQVVPNRFRYLPFLLFLIAILCYGGVFMGYLLSRIDLVNLLRDINNDDSFYYFQIARNLASSHFSTFDGGITRTNGYHPVWMLLLTPFFWVFDIESALIWIKLLELILIVGGVLLIVLSAKLCGLPWIVLLALLPTFYSQPHLFSGMEAAAGLFALGTLFVTLSLFARNPGRWSLLLAAVAFILPWIRLEYLAISLAVTVGVVLFSWLGSEHRNGLFLPSLRRIPLPGFLPLAGACLGGIVYFVYNRLVFGGFLPVSAAAKESWSQALFEHEGGFSITRNFLGFLPVFDGGLLVAAEIGLYTLLVWWLSRHNRSRADWLLLVFLVGAASLAVEHVAKFIQSVLSVHPLWGIYGWYLVPTFLMKGLIVPVRCYVALYLVRALIGPRSKNAAYLLELVIILSSILVIVTSGIFMAPFSWVDKISTSESDDSKVTSYIGAQIINRTLAAAAVVGSWDAGVLGYFSDRPVVNLDGVVNSYDHLNASLTVVPFAVAGEERALVDGYEHLLEDTGGSYTQLLREYGITHFANSRPISTAMAGTLFEGPSFRYNRTGTMYEFKLWSAEQLKTTTDDSGLIDFGDVLWASMDVHFDHRSEEMAAMFGQGLVLILVRHCDRLPDMALLVYWEDGTQGKTIFPWENPRKNRQGYCVMVFELPNGLENPVKIEVVSGNAIERSEVE